ncbi:PLP-dependent transferase [Neocallimastix lanati (nom. inval.)]|nr:PLP-dependent transferase [Neocallimastix sp. JGI-2020a]
MVLQEIDLKNNLNISDNVLKYFLGNQIQESDLQNYIDKIIDEFNRPSPSVFAANRSLLCNVENIYNYFIQIKEKVIDKSTRVSSPNMIGHMTSSLPFFQKYISKLVTALNQNLVKEETSATITFLEKKVLSILHRTFYHQSEEYYKNSIGISNFSYGCFTSGGTIANLTAMWIARNYAFPKTEDFEGIEKEGLPAALKYYGYNGVAIVGSELMHYSFKKAVDILGLGLKNLHTIPVNSLKELYDKKIKIIAIVGIASTTEVGSIDNFEELSNLSKEYNSLFHVDGAWGGSFAFSDNYCNLLKGIEKADTITIDGHKLLYTPMGCGVVLFKSPLLPYKTIKKVASYIIRENSIDQGKITLEGSRPANVFYLHASLSLLGKNGLNELLEISCEKAKYMANLIKNNPHFELISFPVTNIFLYRYIPSCLPKKNSNKNKSPLSLNLINNKYINILNNSNESLISNNPNKTNIKNLPNYLKDDNINLNLENDFHFSLSENDFISKFIDKLQAKQKSEGLGFVSKTTIKTSKYPECKNGISVFRVVIANPLVQKSNIKIIINELIKLGFELENEYL